MFTILRIFAHIYNGRRKDQYFVYNVICLGLSLTGILFKK